MRKAQWPGGIDNEVRRHAGLGGVVNAAPLREPLQNTGCRRAVVRTRWQRSAHQKQWGKRKHFQSCAFHSVSPGAFFSFGETVIQARSLVNPILRQGERSDRQAWEPLDRKNLAAGALLTWT